MDTIAPVELPPWLDQMLPFERYRLDAGGQRISVMEQGAGRPVVLVHGNPTWGFLWRKVAAELAGEPLRLIMPDLVGLGFSSRPVADWHTLDNHIACFGALLDALALEDAVFVVQDWGGPIALGALAERPTLAAGLVILNTVVGPPRPGFKPTLFHRLAHTPWVSDLLFRGVGFPQISLGFAQGDRRSIRGKVSKAYRYPLRGMAKNAAPLRLARMVPDSLEHPSVPGLQRAHEWTLGFEGPIAIVWGDKDPVLGRVIRYLEKLLPQAPVTRTQAGHFLQEEVPVEIAAAVRDVVGRIS